jgi:hypothetical protein
VGRDWPKAFGAWPSPAAKTAQQDELGRCAARARGHHVVGVRAVALPTQRVGGLPVDEVFSSTTGAPWGDGRTRWWIAGLTGAGCPRRRVEMRRRDKVLQRRRQSGDLSSDGDLL